MAEPYEHGDRIIIPDPYVSQFGTEAPGGYDDPHLCTDYELCPHCWQCDACCGCY